MGTLYGEAHSRGQWHLNETGKRWLFWENANMPDEAIAEMMNVIHTAGPADENPLYLCCKLAGWLAAQRHHHQRLLT